MKMSLFKQRNQMSHSVIAILQRTYKTLDDDQVYSAPTIMILAQSSCVKTADYPWAIYTFALHTLYSRQTE
ncbi:hypothetical protein A0H81_01731 [Grifola frondosa]|uniref:Uncharacterized protein n=1 Tax=Grifola frondosa TaxID=5627 RepID=A0A1C7MMM3_GRIFR|nr:hypothetical protein A0H81_01731 [Grifola frondosa]